VLWVLIAYLVAFIVTNAISTPKKMAPNPIATQPLKGEETFGCGMVEEGYAQT